MVTCNLVRFYQDFYLSPGFLSALSALCGECLFAAGGYLAPSVLRHPSSTLRHPSSVIRHPPSALRPPSSVICHLSSVIRLLMRPRAKKDHRKSLHNDLKIKPGGHVANIVEIEDDHLFEGYGASSHNLP